MSWFNNEVIIYLSVLGHIDSVDDPEVFNLTRYNERSVNWFIHDALCAYNCSSTLLALQLRFLDTAPQNIVMDYKLIYPLGIYLGRFFESNLECNS